MLEESRDAGGRDFEVPSGGTSPRSQAQEAAAVQERTLETHKQELDAAEVQAGPMKAEVEQRESDFRIASRTTAQLHRELLVSKRHVDLAQARNKEVRISFERQGVVIEGPSAPSGHRVCCEVTGWAWGGARHLA